MIDFRKKLLNTLEILRPILDDVIIIGSEVPNILNIDKDVELFVSQDIDVGIPLERAGRVKKGLKAILTRYSRSKDEPSVLVPESLALLEINFLGIDRKLRNIDQAYIVNDKTLPFLVLGNLSLIKPYRAYVKNLELIIAEPVSLIIEKLLTDRSSIKGERDLTVARLLMECIGLRANKHKIVERLNRFNREKRHLLLDNIATLILLAEKSNVSKKSLKDIRDILAKVKLK